MPTVKGFIYAAITGHVWTGITHLLVFLQIDVSQNAHLETILQ